MSEDQNAANIMQTVNIVGSLLLAAQSSYQQAREIAAKAGVSDEDLAAADARYARTLERTRPDGDPTAKPHVAAPDTPPAASGDTP